MTLSTARELLIGRPQHWHLGVFPPRYRVTLGNGLLFGLSHGCYQVGSWLMGLANRLVSSEPFHAPYCYHCHFLFLHWHRETHWGHLRHLVDSAHRVGYRRPPPHVNN